MRELRFADLANAIPGLIVRLAVTGGAPVICRYKTLHDLVAQPLRTAGHDVLRFPSSYAAAAERDCLMEQLCQRIRRVAGLPSERVVSADIGKAAPDPVVR